MAREKLASSQKDRLGNPTSAYGVGFQGVHSTQPTTLAVKIIIRVNQAIAIIADSIS